MKLIVEKFYPDSKLPTYGYPGDAGMDLYASGDFKLKPRERLSVPTGIKMKIPKGYVGLIWDKSGLSHRTGLKTLGGVIDASYRGEVFVGLINLGQKTHLINKGDKIAQMLIQKFESAKIAIGQVKTDTHRGGKGFGSSGK